MASHKNRSSSINNTRSIIPPHIIGISLSIIHGQRDLLLRSSTGRLSRPSLLHSKPNMILKALINMAFTENHTHRIFGRHLYSLLFDYGDAPFELTELDRLALTSDYAHAHALPGTQALAFSALASDVFWRRLAGDR